MCLCVWQCCVAGVLIGIPISIQRKSYKPFAILGVLGTAMRLVHACVFVTVAHACLSVLASVGSFVDYSVPYTNDCRLIHNAMQLALQQERQRDAAAAASSALGATTSTSSEQQ